MIRELEAAISAGSVIPIHFIDAAIMAQITGNKDIVSIHDAIIPPLNRVKDRVKWYNKNVFDINRGYNFVGEVNNMIGRIQLPKNPDMLKKIL